MSGTENGTLEMDVVLYPEGDRWIAQGLQFDVTARGDTPTEASDRFDEKVGAELIMSIELGDETPLSGVGQAPQKFWRMFEEAKMRVEKDQHFIRIVDGGKSAKVHARMKIAGKAAA